MGNIFAASEIVEIGIQIEKNGRDFYRALVKQSKSPKLQEVFNFLAGEEEKHIEVFNRLLDSLDGSEPPQSYPEEYSLYMKALASEQVFTQQNKGEQIAKTVKADKEALSLGIGFEKDSIVFYEGMKKVVPEYELEAIEELIRQEQKHLRQLAELKKEI